MYLCKQKSRHGAEIRSKYYKAMKKYLVTKIFWDVDCPEDLEDLPQNVEVECEDEDEIADILSDDYGFCVNSFNAELDV